MPRTPVPIRRRRTSAAWPALALMALAATVAIPGLCKRDIATSHEARVVQTARAMAEAGWPWAAKPVDVPVVTLAQVNGIKRLRPNLDVPPMSVNPWLVPVMNGRVRLQKPPLPYWAAAVSIRLFGYSEEAARLPGALLFAASAGLVFDLGRRVFGRRAGWLAGLVWASTYFIADEHRKAMADPYLAFFTLLAVWAWIRAGRLDANEAAPTNGRRSRPYGLLIFYLALAAGTMAKGPLAVLHVGLALVAYQLCVGGRLPGRRWHHAIGVAAYLVASLPWPAYVARVVPNAIELWRYELDNGEKPRPAYFYLPAVLLIALPWTPIWATQAVVSIGRWWRAAAAACQRRRRRELFPLLWLGAVVLAFSVAPVKKNAYLLPAMPAIALAAGLGLSHLISLATRRAQMTFDSAGIPQRDDREPMPPYVRHPRQARAMLAVVIGLGAVAAGVVTFQCVVTAGHVRVAAGAAAAASAVAALAVTAFAFRRSPRRAWPVAQSAVFGLAVIAFINHVIAPGDNRRSAKAACESAAALLHEGGRTIATSRMSEEVGVYLPLDPYDLVRPESRFATKVLLVWDDGDGVELRQRHVPTKPFDPTGWPVEGGRVTAFRRVPLNGNPGDVRWQLWELTVDRSTLALARLEPR